MRHLKSEGHWYQPILVGLHGRLDSLKFDFLCNQVELRNSSYLIGLLKELLIVNHERV